MGPNRLVFMTLMVAVVVGTTLAWTNPQTSTYREKILTPRAAEEADRIADGERRSLEDEATRLHAELSAVRYEGRQLERASLQRRYPRFAPAFLANSHSDSVLARLSETKASGIKRIEVTRQAILHGTVASLSRHTDRRSYVLWSVFSTCDAEHAISYIGVGTLFLEYDEPQCRDYH